MATTVTGAVCGTQASGKVYQRAYMTYTVTTTSTQVLVTVTSGIQQGNKNWNTKIKSYCTLAATGNSTLTSVLTTGGSYSTAWHSYQHFSKTFTFNRGASASSATITATSCLRSSDIPTSVISNAYGRAAVIDKTSTAKITVSIPARASYTISYDANGGTGAPANQIKLYDTAITLSTGVPTKAGSQFYEWNTQANGLGTSYRPGATYSTNANLVLYAIWKNPISVKVNGAWKTGEPLVKVNGVWKSSEAVYVKVNGVWKSI